jgi:uncharacterized C2H2 Zn-finger protein
MNWGLKYLIKNEINEELDNLFLLSLIKFKHRDGEICFKCGIIQGSSFNGWKKYYCKHMEKKVNKELEKKEKKIKNKFFSFNLACQDDKIVA